MSERSQDKKRQKTRKGYEIPVPKREDVLRDLRKGARIKSAPRRPKK